MKTGMKTGRKPKPENEKQGKYRCTIYGSKDRLTKLGLVDSQGAVDTRAFSALLRALLADHESKSAIPEPTSQKG